MMVKADSSKAIAEFMANGGKVQRCRPAKGNGKSVFLLERQQEQNAMMGFGPILNCDLSRKQKAAKARVTFITEKK